MRAVYIMSFMGIDIVEMNRDRWLLTIKAIVPVHTSPTSHKPEQCGQQGPILITQEVIHDYLVIPEKLVGLWQQTSDCL